MKRLLNEDSQNNVLPVILGNDQNGLIKTIDLNVIPGLLVETNHNTETISVFNSIISNLLSQNAPEDLRFAIFNSKRNGFKYDSLPQQYVNYFGKKSMVRNGISTSILLLELFMEEIDNRYELLMKARARNLKDYNEKNKEKLPRLVIFINDFREFSDKSGREFEGKLARLVLLGKAVGIYLIIATSRVDLYVKSVFIDQNFPVQMIFNREITPGMDKTINDSKKKLNKLSDYLYVNKQKKRIIKEPITFHFIKGIRPIIT